MGQLVTYFWSCSMGKNISFLRIWYVELYHKHIFSCSTMMRMKTTFSLLAVHDLTLTFILDKEVITIKASCLFEKRWLYNNAFERLLKQPWGRLMIINHSFLIHILLSCAGFLVHMYVYPSIKAASNNSIFLIY